MTSSIPPLGDLAFERLCERVAVAAVHCSDSQVLDLADSLHAALRLRRKAESPRAQARRAAYRATDSRESCEFYG